jgi:hypothetical protein
MDGGPKNFLSQAEVFALIKRKVHRVVLYPQVSEQIQNLRLHKALKGRLNPDDEYPTVSHADLINAIKTGVITSHSPLFPPQTGWTANIEGVGCDGRLLAITVEVSQDDEPLIIASFVIPQP